MVDKPVPLTKDGMRRLEEELDHLKTVRRHEVADRIQQAKELVTTINNAEYDDAKNEQAFVEGRILTIERMLQNAVIIDEEQAHHAKNVQIGSSVTVVHPNGNTEDYTIVGAAEANPREGRISNESPVGRALLGKRVGEKVHIAVPAGMVELTIGNIH
jgi:transcription elongation factor GreA